MAETKAIRVLLGKHSTITEAVFTTKTLVKTAVLVGKTMKMIPSALYCYSIGRNITSRLDAPLAVTLTTAEERKPEEMEVADDAEF